jgi:hypothetical protein
MVETTKAQDVHLGKLSGAEWHNPATFLQEMVNPPLTRGDKSIMLCAV